MPTTTYALPLWDPPSVPIAGSNDRFPVRHIFCVGRNYAEHAKEMGGDATKEPPFFFTKAADSIVAVVPPNVGRIRYPAATQNLHHEMELVVAIGRSGVDLTPERAKRLPEHALIMHPGPMNRGVEMAVDPAELPGSMILHQVTNGVAVRMAVLFRLLGSGDDLRGDA